MCQTAIVSNHTTIMVVSIYGYIWSWMRENIAYITSGRPYRITDRLTLYGNVIRS